MSVKKININQTEPTYDIASNAYDITYEDSNVGEKLSELGKKFETTPIVVNSSYSTGYINSSGTVTETEDKLSVYSDFVEIENGYSYFYESTSVMLWNIGYYSSANESAFISAQ